MSEKVKATKEDTGIREFVSGASKEGTSIKRRAASARHSYARKQRNATFKELLSNQLLIILVAYAVSVVAVILLGALVCDVAVVPVCTIVLIQTLLAVCLHNLALWIHVTVMTAEIICGVIFGQVLLMVLAAVLYLAAIVALQYIRKAK